LQLQHVYSLPDESGWWHSVQRLLFGHLTAALLFFGVLYLVYREYSRLQSTYFLFLAFIGLFGYRTALVLYRRFAMSRAGSYAVLVIGTDTNAVHIAKTIGRYQWMGFAFVGFVRQYSTDSAHPETAGRIIGDAVDLQSLIQLHHVREVIIAVKWSEQDFPAKTLYLLQGIRVNIRLAQDFAELTSYHVATETFGGIALIGVREDVLSPSQRYWKRFFDVIISLLVVLFGFPVFILIGLCIWLEDRQPVILVQRRVGENGRLFPMYKFRSMLVNTNASPGPHKLRSDPRVTRVGRFIRRTSLDELPQFINVLRGDMSLVGPRPEMPWLVDQYAPWQRKRFDVPQGLTGWWQVNGRADRPMHLNTDDDLFYIQHYSLWLDLQILFRTVFVVIVGRGAF